MHYPIHCMYVRKPYFALGLLVYNDRNSKLISWGRVTSRPTI